jgi:hypothetical protein
MAHHKQPLQAAGGCLARRKGMGPRRQYSSILSYLVEGSILSEMEAGGPDPLKSNACHDKTVYSRTGITLAIGSFIEYLFPYGNISWTLALKLI